MARRLLIAGNWKMHLSASEGAALASSIVQGVGKNPKVDVLICPTFPGLAAAVAATAGSAVAVGGQNCYWETQGAFTGEISAGMLKAVGCSHVLLGHSERRQYFGETDETVNKRLKAVLAAGLVPVLCIGETLAERDGGLLEAVLSRQIKGAFAGFTAAQLATVVVAYEPVWAIGTGRVASEQQAQDAHAYVRSVIAQVLGAEAANSMRILYGGSVKPDNAKGLMGQPDIDGALVGGASLKAESFLGIISNA